MDLTIQLTLLAIDLQTHTRALPQECNVTWENMRDNTQCRGGSGGGVVGFEQTPLFADSFDLLVLCYSQLCLTLSAGVPVQFGYCIISVQFNVQITVIKVHSTVHESVF